MGPWAQVFVGPLVVFVVSVFFSEPLAEMSLDWAATALEGLGYLAFAIVFWGAVVWLVKWIFFEPVYFD